MDECLGDDAMLALVQGELDDETADRARAHIDVCDDCRTVLAETARFYFEHSLSGAKANAPGSDDDAPSQIERYQCLGVIGAGASGIVYAAYDPKLERKVALKILHKGQSTSGRLLVEAQ